VDADWALHLTKLGASLGEVKCLEQLAAYCEQGICLPRDPAKASELRRAAARGQDQRWLRIVANHLERLPVEQPVLPSAPGPEIAKPLAQLWIQGFSRQIQDAASQTIGNLIRPSSSPRSLSAGVTSR
jgi:hypothetical protein